MNTDQLSMPFGNERIIKQDWLQIHHFVNDRGSKYSVTAGSIHNQKDLKQFLSRLKADKKYAKATHNIFAARFVEDGHVIERKSDDGETGGAMIILRGLRNANLMNTCIVVTRWYGGTHLGADRFKHIQDGVTLILQTIQ